MKKLIFTLLFCLFNLTLYAQVQVISSSPANGDFAVDQDSIVLEFNIPVYIDPEFPSESGFYFFIEPESQVQLDSIRLSDDHLKVIIYGQLTTDTDYVAVLEQVRGEYGEDLDMPYLFQFTTAQQPGPYSVTGNVSRAAMDKLASSSDGYEGVAVILSRAPLDFNINFTDEEPPSEEEGDIIPAYATMVDTLTGEYTLTGVREGNYYPIGLNILQGGDDMHSEFELPEIYWIDQNKDFIPDSIIVNDQTTTNNVLSGVNLTQLAFHPFLISEADSLARELLATLPNSPELIGGGTYYFSIFDNYGPAYKNSMNLPERNHRMDVQLHMSPIWPFNHQNSTSNHGDMSFIEVFGEPSGYQFVWEMYAYDAVKDSALMIVVTPFGSQVVEYIGIPEAELPPNVSFSDIKPMPESYLDSDQAVSIFETEGGANFRSIYDYAASFGYGFWELNIQLLHEFWNYAPNPTPTAPVMWKASYFGARHNMDTGSFDDDSLIIYLDINTGQVLHSETSLNQAITFDDAVDTVRTILSTFENSPVLVGGESSYHLQPPFSSPGEVNKGRQEQPQLFFNGMTYQNEYRYGYQVHPNGYQLDWMIYAYDAVKDSAMSFYVSSDQVEFNGYFGKEEAELPAGVEFTDIKPLPDTYIGSAEAVTIMENNGGMHFRQRFSKNDHNYTQDWSLWLLALHMFWEFEPNPTSSAPVMWSGRYYGNSYDFGNEQFMNDSLYIYIDIQTGEVLHMLVSTDEEAEVPSTIRLFQNYPNPFNPLTHISFELAQASQVKLEVFNLLGQKVAVLANARYNAGQHTLDWDASEHSSGIYFYRLEASGGSFTRKLMLLK